MSFEANDDHSQKQVIRLRIEVALSSNVVDWNVVDNLFLLLSVSSAEDLRSSLEDDPMGRLILGTVLSLNPPVTSLQAALRAFPDSLNHNPAAFAIACQHSSSEIISEMTLHTVTRTNCNKNTECPYPWIFSNLITVEGAQAMLEVFPHGVLQKSSFLSDCCPLDYFLKSSNLMEIDNVMWSKFKLLLVAAECSESHPSEDECYHISPVHVILKRIFSYPGFFDNLQGAQHALWLLHQLYSTDKWIFEKKDGNGVYPLQYVLGHKCSACDHDGRTAARELIKILLKAHPQSARYMVQKRLAIHMAVENGWPCHDLLLAVFPEALDQPDSKTDLLPFQTAAAAGLDITFELLLANPTHVLRAQA